MPLYLETAGSSRNNRKAITCLYYGNRSFSYQHIHFYHGFNLGSETNAIKMVVAQATSSYPLVGANGNPLSTAYMGRLYYARDAAVNEEIDVKTNFINQVTGYPLPNSTPPPTTKDFNGEEKSQFAWWINKNGWSTYSSFIHNLFTHKS